MKPILLALITLFLCAGCEEEQLEYTEVKRIDERLNQRELETYFRVVQALPNQKLPPLPLVYSAPPEWDETRTLAVSELMAAEQDLINARWDIATLAKHWESNKSLKRVLRQEKMTVEQFVGLTVVLGVTFNLETLRPSQDLVEIERVGLSEIERLSQDDRPYSSLSIDGRAYVLQQAVWLTRVDRARHLLLVPDDNRDLVALHREELKKILPPEFLANPLDAVADVMLELGTPFKLAGNKEDDADITWDRDDALIGYDQPDQK